METKTILVNFRVAPALKAAMLKQAKAEGRTLSNYLENLVRGNLSRKAKANGGGKI